MNQGLALRRATTHKLPTSCQPNEAMRRDARQGCGWKNTGKCPTCSDVNKFVRYLPHVVTEITDISKVIDSETYRSTFMLHVFFSIFMLHVFSRCYSDVWHSGRALLAFMIVIKLAIFTRCRYSCSTSSQAHNLPINFILTICLALHFETPNSSQSKSEEC